MPLVVFKREDRSLYGKCEGCNNFLELRDDPKVYPKTVAVVCRGNPEDWYECYDYMWLLVSAKAKQKAKPEKEKAVSPDMATLNEILTNLKKLGTRRP